jgi:hypothetical protein
MNLYNLNVLHPNALTRLRMQPAMHGMAGLLFLFNFIGAYNVTDGPISFRILLLVMAFQSLAFPFFYKKFKKPIQVNSLLRAMQSAVLLLSACYFIAYGYVIVGLTLFLASLGMGYIGYAEFQMLKSCQVAIRKEGIMMPGVFKTRTFYWSQLDHSIIKNDHWTIDFKNNKIIQLEILEDLTATQIAEINQYLQNRIQGT